MHEMKQFSLMKTRKARTPLARNSVHICIYCDCFVFCAFKGYYKPLSNNRRLHTHKMRLSSFQIVYCVLDDHQDDLCPLRF